MLPFPLSVPFPLSPFLLSFVDQLADFGQVFQKVECYIKIGR